VSTVPAAIVVSSNFVVGQRDRAVVAGPIDRARAQPEMIFGITVVSFRRESHRFQSGEVVSRHTTS
jgi:hypothetical protein